MTDAIIEFFRSTLNNDILTIFIISMLPIIELRGAIPVAIAMEMPWHAALGYAFLGSIAVVPVLLLVMMPILNLMKKVKFFDKIANVVEGMFKSKAESISKRIGAGDTEKRVLMIKLLGVLAFVAIPMPLTGVWTGSAVAVFLGLGFWKSLLVISIGNMSAGLIMTALSVLLEDHINIFLTVFMIVVLVFLVANIAYSIYKHKKKSKQAEINGDVKTPDDNLINSADDSNCDSAVDSCNNADDSIVTDCDDNKDDSSKAGSINTDESSEAGSDNVQSNNLKDDKKDIKGENVVIKYFDKGDEDLQV